MDAPTGREFPFRLRERSSPGAQIREVGEGVWRLELPPGPGGRYRLAQLDDYTSLPRRKFPHRPPSSLALEARACAAEIPGTWGFGLWNDPFGMGMPGGGLGLRLPALPNAAWFFYASPPNYLSLRDDLPAQGGMAAVFRSPRLPSGLSLLAIPALPFIFIPPAVRLLRRTARRFVRQACAPLADDPTAWHAYRLDWTGESACLSVDGDRVLETDLSPLGPLAVVMWIDNQYAALPPDGRPRYGTLPAKEANWIELRSITLKG